MFGQQARNIGVVGPFFGQDFTRKIAKLGQFRQEIAGIALLRHLKTTGHQQDEQKQKNAAI